MLTCTQTLHTHTHGKVAVRMEGPIDMKYVIQHFYTVLISTKYDNQGIENAELGYCLKDYILNVTEEGMLSNFQKT